MNMLHDMENILSQFKTSEKINYFLRREVGGGDPVAENFAKIINFIFEPSLRCNNDEAPMKLT